MSNQNPKLVMMRFDPRGGWSKPSDDQLEAQNSPQSETPSTLQNAPQNPAQTAEETTAQTPTPNATPIATPITEPPPQVPPAAAQPAEKFSPESLNDLGDSIMALFNSLKINDPRLQVWEEVNSAIRQMSDKLTEIKQLEDRLVAIRAEIDGLRSQTSELVACAYQSEVDVNATSKLRVQVAEILNMKITKVLQG